MPEPVGKIFECLLCRNTFSTTDIVKGKYFASTGICRACYEEGQKTENSIWCFGSYSVEYTECKFDCPDRKICKGFTQHQNEEHRDAENG